MFDRIHHVAIICSDYDKSKRFYTEVLGCEVLRETYRAERQSYKLDLKVGGDYQIELFSFPNPPKRITNPEAAGLRHLAFEASDFETAISQLKARGVQFEPPRIDELTGKKFIFFRDPDKLPLELYEK
jgi:glyoxylase I family protein